MQEYGDQVEDSADRRPQSLQDVSPCLQGHQSEKNVSSGAEEASISVGKAGVMG